jgi:hypothetical protein
MQVPDAFPIVPPPSKRADEPGIPVADMPLLDEIPGIEPPMPDDTCGSEPPMLEHVVMLPGAAPNGDVPDVIGLTPGVESSVAPMGIPVRATAGAGPIPSGDVIPSGDPDGPIPPICADTEPLASRTAVNIASDPPASLSERAICNLHFSAGGHRPHRDHPLARAEPIPFGRWALDRLVSQGKLRHATQADIEAWRNGGRNTLNRLPAGSGLLEVGRTYVVLGKVTLPRGLIGSATVNFIVPSKASVPKGEGGRNRFFSMADHRCEPDCR